MSTRKRVNNAERSKWNAGNAAGGILGCRLCVGVPMTAHLHSAVVESTNSIIDFDAEARHAADGELDARFQSEAIPLLEPLYRHAMRMTRNHADAEDLLQDTMMKAYSAFRSFKQDTNLYGWLSRIMTNTYINGYRKQRRRPLHYLPGNFTEELQSTALHQSSTGTQSAEQQALDKLGDTVIREAMRALPDQFRLAVYYADVEGFSTKEIADLMQTPVGTVTSRVYRGRRMLRRFLAGVAEERENTMVEDAA
jgi:RNA polymerase sigma-70 factor (ECF subfamily)